MIPVSALKLFAGCLIQWIVFFVSFRSGLPLSAAFSLACFLGIWHFRPHLDITPWLKILRAGLFPATYCALGLGSDFPSWIWGLLFGGGLLLFPRLDAESAPLWRSPKELGVSLGIHLSSSQQYPKRVLDAGCGLGDGVLALRTALPQACVEGIETAWIPWFISRMRCGADIQQGNLWTHPWHSYDLIYLFLRPEAMHRAYQKCQQELSEHALVASLDFEFQGIQPWLSFEPKEGRIVRLYRTQDFRTVSPMVASGPGF